MTEEEIELAVKKMRKKADLYGTLIFLIDIIAVGMGLTIIMQKIMKSKPYIYIVCIAIFIIILGFILIKYHDVKTKKEYLLEILKKLGFNNCNYSPIKKIKIIKGDNTQEGSIRYNYKYQITINPNLIIYKHDMEVLIGTQNYSLSGDNDMYYSWKFRKTTSYIEFHFLNTTKNIHNIKDLLPNQYGIEEINADEIIIRREAKEFIDEALAIKEVNNLYNIIKEHLNE